MNFMGFYVGRLPKILFGAGQFAELPALIREQGRRALILRGEHSFRDSPHWPRLVDGLERLAVTWCEMAVDGEPSPALIDAIVSRMRGEGIEVVVGIGGGSVLDAAKAVAGLLPSGDSVLEYLEDVGRGRPYHGPALPFIAVPTTAGTGSEATRNAVLSHHGEAGYKKSFRHDLLVAQAALIDPQLLTGCPPRLIAAQGMDAFTQLLESFVSLRASPFTDALAWSGLQAVNEGFFSAWLGDESAAAANGRAAMAYGALLSGITLAQAGLGSVHGLAQPLGSFFPVPHGVACGTILAVATEVNIRALRARGEGGEALVKYARVGRLLSEMDGADDTTACNVLVETLNDWTERLELPRLGEYGISEEDIPRIVAASRGNSMKTNPVLLTDEEIGGIVRRRL